MLAVVTNLTLIINKVYSQRKCSHIKLFARKHSYKVLFFGSDSIALKSLQKVNEFRKSENIIKRLDFVTSNNTKTKSEIEKYALAEGIGVRTWPLQKIATSEYDIGLIVAFGHLIKDNILNKFPLGIINVHPSLLPRWRGAAPIIHTLLHGDQQTGVSLMRIKANVFDVGEIISQRKIAVSKDIKLPELTEQLSDIGADMLVECIRLLPDSLVKAQPQSNYGVTYARKINKSISEVRWTEMKATDVYNLYRAVYGLYPLSSKFRDKTVKLFGAFLDHTEEIEKSHLPIGTLKYCHKVNAIKVLCKDMKYICFKSIRIVGKREISALDFYNGYIKNALGEKRCTLAC
ncbi:unnamed protein product [Diatraea saccharalis]|uniref:Methionyl-tRNA formyltransferase, mitochondrial n=1 Tax=Diatraea saccharalis TaxID=40085 RepID=A0A9N9RF38_9NEOP|nr:unnamed protein product [Diatraea saccharalis]